MKHPKLTTFIKYVKKCLMKECKEARNETRAPNIQNVIIRAADSMEMQTNPEKIKKWRFPVNFNFFDDLAIEAIYCLIMINGLRSAQDFTKAEFGLANEAIFQKSKQKWIKVTKRKFKQHMCNLLATGKPVMYINQLMDASAEYDIQFSLTRVKMMFKDPEDLDDRGYWEKLWLNLTTDTISKIPLFWDEDIKKKYPQKAYPLKGYLVTKPLPEMEPRGSLPITKSKSETTSTKPQPEATTPKLQPEEMKPPLKMTIHLNEDKSVDKFWLMLLHKIDPEHWHNTYKEFLWKNPRIQMRINEIKQPVRFSSKVSNTEESTTYWFTKYYASQEIQNSHLRFEAWYYQNRYSYESGQPGHQKIMKKRKNKRKTNP